MTFATALISLIISAIPGNIVDLYGASLLDGNVRKSNILRITTLISFFICFSVATYILIQAGYRSIVDGASLWSLFVMTIWFSVCGYLLIGAVRDYFRVSARNRESR